MVGAMPRTARLGGHPPTKASTLKDDRGMRDAILKVVQDHPGASLQFIAGRVGCTHSLVSYHAAILSRVGRLRQVREGRCLRNYPPITDSPAWEQHLAPVLRDQRRRDVIELLARNPRREWNGHQLAVAAHVSYTMLLSTIRALRRHEFVTVDRVPSGRYKIRATRRLSEAWTRYV